MKSDIELYNNPHLSQQKKPLSLVCFSITQLQKKEEEEEKNYTRI